MAGNNQGSVHVKVEGGSHIVVTDTTTAASLCSVFVSVLLAPGAGGTIAVRRRSGIGLERTVGLGSDS